MSKIAIIGGGFAGLSAACYLAKEGHDVSLYEKNSDIGGRARKYEQDGFTFDMGPTFYWMPDIFEKFFSDFDKKTTDYYELIRLNPGYRIFFEKNDFIDMSANQEELFRRFEEEETGSSIFLKKFLKSAEFNYKAAMGKVVYKPGKSPLELISPDTARRLGQFFSTISRVIRKNIKSRKLTQCLEFPVIFLGAQASKIPAFYCFMNYADLVLGTWHIRGGMYNLVDALQQLGSELGVKYHTDATVEKINVKNKKAESIIVNGTELPVDFVISGADYYHSEFLLEEKYRNYKPEYWKKKDLAPSALLFYAGFDKKVKNATHHTLCFDTDFDTHAEKIFDNPGWPEKPLFYCSFPSMSDDLAAPPGKETAIFLIPLAPGIPDGKEIREKYFNQIILRLEKLTNQKLRNSVLFHKSYCVTDFIKDYNAYKGNAYGLANTLRQTAFLKPGLENRKIRNLLYTGQLTVPGPGVAPSIISGKIAASLASKKLKTKKYVTAF